MLKSEFYYLLNDKFYGKYEVEGVIYNFFFIRWEIVYRGSRLYVVGLVF